MASARGLADYGVLIPLFSTITAASTAYAGHVVFWRSDWRGWLVDFVSGPGRTSRLLLLAMVLINLKSVPFVWTVSVWSGSLCSSPSVSLQLSRSPYCSHPPCSSPLLSPLLSHSNQVRSAYSRL